ncbi:MAG: DUF3419 family protein [Bdellovibrionales bacterium]|nr:DUF3419 family protein [Bdellovibrionales bacterium]
MSRATSYFSQLNYTLANEDTALEVALLPEKTDTILSIAGSGSRVVPLLSRSPRRVICVDLSPAQLALTELRISLVREVSRSEFMAFLGYPCAEAEKSPEKLRKHWLEKLELRPETRSFCRDWLSSRDWQSPIYSGRWEKTFQTLSALVQRMVGTTSRELFDCRTVAEQQDFLRTRFAHQRWHLAVALFGNASVFNALLYKGSFPKKNIPGSRFHFYRDAYSRLFSISPARQNFFLQLSFLGHLEFEEGNPVECDSLVFEKAKEALGRSVMEYVHADAVEAAQKERQNIGFLSFSDVPSYFKGDTERQFMQKIRSGLNDQALVVVRNYLRVPSQPDLRGFVNLREEHREVIAQEKVQVYTVDVFRHDSK